MGTAGGGREVWFLMRKYAYVLNTVSVSGSWRVKRPFRTPPAEVLCAGVATSSQLDSRDTGTGIA